ncbi:hypothetical protein B0F90DRAFT_1069633 [Multifurca ochricompacta]|uniref:PB1 domain-containing protein n=1 Tax=Multifurca ochricompacta TaxID=376703 RepID=A0AAD4MAJ4_9AGAM|nr:hypothetical protein B0F90DRAFT_1069633 [Multifurca ochricompacta]
MRRASERSNSRLAHLSTPNGYTSSNPRNGPHERGLSSNPFPSISLHPHANGIDRTANQVPMKITVPGTALAAIQSTQGVASVQLQAVPHPGWTAGCDDAWIGPVSWLRSTTCSHGRLKWSCTIAMEKQRTWSSSWPKPSDACFSLGIRNDYSSEQGFDASLRSNTGRSPLRSQYSSSRLRPPYETGEQRSGATSPSTLPATTHLSRTRSASQPSAYAPKGAPPPLPSNGWDGMQGSSTSTATKRSSGSSQSTGEDSAYSPNSSSPITPFGSSDSSLSGVVGRSSILSYEAPVKVKVHFGSDIFVIQVARTVEYGELVERVSKKIRLCGPRRDDGPLRVKYEDEEGDLISMRSTEDVDMAFGDKTQVVLHVAI